MEYAAPQPPQLSTGKSRARNLIDTSEQLTC